MDVQSHTRTHRILQTLSPAELSAELLGSKQDLERELGEPARAIAYPVGRPLSPSSPIRAALMQAGYEIGFTNGTGPTSQWARAAMVTAYPDPSFRLVRCPFGAGCGQ